MYELNQNQIMRQDFVDNAIYDLINLINPTSKPIDWDIELIGIVRDSLKSAIVDRLNICNEMEFYPFINSQE
ncbi:hypothetical protein JW926_11560 [Candidatus Sumerlaeota bacterium]|nr:hypothetical protein [Candidatus Sumerlaeota bacterium]